MMTAAEAAARLAAVRLSPQRRGLVNALLARFGDYASRDELLDSIITRGGPVVVAQQMQLLRRDLEPTGLTVSGRIGRRGGYRLHALVLALALLAAPAAAEAPAPVPALKPVCASAELLAVHMPRAAVPQEIHPHMRPAIAALWAQAPGIARQVKRRGMPTGALLWRLPDGSHLIVLRHGDCLGPVLPVRKGALGAVMAVVVGAAT